MKRVIGLPGETITQCETNRVCIDGRLLEESYLPKGTITDHSDHAALHHQHVGREGPRVRRRQSRGWVHGARGQGLRDGRQRTNSQDARVNGPIKESSIVGRVFLRIWPPGRIGFM